MLQTDPSFLCNLDQTQNASCFRVKEPCEVCSEKSEAMDVVELQCVHNKPVVEEENQEETPGNGTHSNHHMQGATEVSSLLSATQKTPGNGTHSNHHTQGATEDSSLLSAAQGAERNGEHAVVSNLPDGTTEQKPTVLERLRHELNEKVIWKIRVWMGILLVLICIVLLIMLFAYLCSECQEDVDDKYDVSSFVVPLFFRGSFILANQSLGQDSMSLSDSNNTLFENLKQKLTDIYKSSHALERYFLSATINQLRQTNASVRFGLEFRMPNDNEPLKRYTLNKEMVYHVLLQHTEDTEDPLYIEADSLTMEGGKWE